MKERFYYSIPLTIILALLIYTLCPEDIERSTRSDYEYFLVGLSADLEEGIKEGNSAKPGTDKPEWAAYNEFVKTVDPHLKVVPLERRLEAFESTQTMDALKSLGSDLEWTSRKADRGGRTRMMMFDPNDPDGMAMYAGAVTGGLWHTSNPLEGSEWEIIDDFWPNLAISSMAFDPNNTQTMYVGTGESETALIIYRESSGRGAGLYRTTNGGRNWDIIPSTEDWAYVTDVVVRDENGQSIIYAGVASGIYKGAGHVSEPADGLYRSDDEGDSWEQVLPLIPGTNRPYVPSDICFSADGKRIYVGTTYGLNINANGNEWSGAACLLHSDNGHDWEVNRDYNESISGTSANAFPGRVMLASDPGNPDKIYAIIAAGSKFVTWHSYGCAYLLKSIDRGETWEELNFPDGFATLAWHAFAIGINPQNPDIIWLGGLDTWRSTDGGDSWRKMSDWTGMYGNGSPNYVHGDIHQFLHKPDNGREMYIATDGGIFMTGSSTSPDNPRFYERCNSFNTLQYYTCAISPVEGRDHLIGGMQDNGTMQYKPGDIPNFLDRLSGGDGAYCFFDQDESGLVITTSQYTGLNTWDLDDMLTARIIYFELTNFGTFINPMDYDWRNNILYVNGGESFGNLANHLGIGHVSKESFDGVPVEIPTNTTVPFSSVKWDETNEADNGLFLGTQSGLVYEVINPEASCIATEISENQIPNGYISCIETGQSSDTLLVTLSNYGVISVWLTTDKGGNWRNIEGNLPDMPIRWGLFHPESSEHIMLATETGIWTSDNVFDEVVYWKPNSNGLANVRVDMLRMRKSDKTVVAATHGRGLFTTVWNLTDLSTVDNITDQDDFLLYPNPSEGIINLEFPLIDDAQVSIVDICGRKVFSERFRSTDGQIQISIESEPPGVYCLQLQAKNMSYSRKFVMR